MPTRTTDTQLFEGEYIKCAKMVIDEPCSWKAAQVVSFGTNYEFQMAIKAAADTTITIQVGDSSETLDVTTDWQRYAISFPNVTISESTSLYILFPIGTYWIYNMQLERAKTPSSWRPAPEDAEDYADQAAKQAVDAQTQLDVFNKLTNNGTVQGIYLLDGQLYINGEYIAANTLSGNAIQGGTISGTQINIGDGVFTVDENGQVQASNLHMTGGSLNLATTNETYDFIKLLYSSWETLFRAQSLTMAYNNTLQSRKYQVVVGPLGITGYLNENQTLRGLDISLPSGTDSTSTGGITIFDGAGKSRVLITKDGITMYDAASTPHTICMLKPPSGSTSDYTGTLKLYDGAGTQRVLLDSTGLKFYNASGTLTKTYSAT